jgi:hypothetical protein
MYGLVPPVGLPAVRVMLWPLSIVAEEGETVPAVRAELTVTRLVAEVELEGA